LTPEVIWSEPGAMSRVQSLGLAVFAAALFATACSGDDDLNKRDGGGGEDATVTTADASADAGLPRDASTPDAGSGGCNVLAPTGSPEQPAARTGGIDIIDYDFYDETFDHARARTRNMSIGFFTGTLTPSPISDGVMFTGIARDTCVAMDIAVPRTVRPARNVGTEITIANEAGVTARFTRSTDAMGEIQYRLATQADTVRFFDRSMVILDDRWTWSTPGDASAGVRATSAIVGPVEDFEVDPAFTSTGAPAMLALSGTTIRWTAPVDAPGEFSIALARALNPQGDAHYLLCRPIDDGEYTISATDMAAFAPTPGLAFDLAVSRSAAGAFCNEGVPSGAMIHSLVYLGTGVTP
jgi:hypothetical protein